MIPDEKSIKEASEQLNKLLSSVPNQIKRINIEIDLCDKEIIDILHVIELTNFHASDGYKLAKDIKITRETRRNLKNELETLRAIGEATKKNRNTLHHTMIINKTIDEQIGRRNNRMYTPRVRMDFKDVLKK